MILTKTVLSTYSADTFGVCSALYELGGLVVMHDASGCNSTYNTHDEPRWYTMDSMVFISGVTEKDILFGSDKKLIDDVCTAAEENHPSFIALCGSPLPLATGTDFRAAAKIIEQRTGIPAFGFPTNGMNTYLTGAGMAFEAIARCVRAEDGSVNRSKKVRAGRPKVNLLGVTPLDFSVAGNAEAMRKVFSRNGLTVRSTWAMGEKLPSVLTSGDADVNLAVSAAGFKAAKVLKERFGIPYIAGVPAGDAESKLLARRLLAAAEGTAEPDTETGAEAGPDGSCDFMLIGEPVFISSVKEELQRSYGMKKVRCICPMPDAPRELTAGMEIMIYEPEIRDAMNKAEHVLADPFYARLIPDTAGKFISLPHEAYSGRYYRKDIPLFIGAGLNDWLKLQAGL